MTTIKCKMCGSGKISVAVFPNPDSIVMNCTDCSLWGATIDTIRPMREYTRASEAEVYARA